MSLPSYQAAIAESQEVELARGFESSCCSAKVWAPTDDWAQCLDCKEMCDAIEITNQ